MDPCSLLLKVLCTKASHCRNHSFILCKVTQNVFINNWVCSCGIVLYDCCTIAIEKKLYLLYFYHPVYRFIHRGGGDICFS